MNSFLSKFLFKKTKFKKSYSQSGEDMILNIIFSTVNEGFYIDVGANDPFKQSNTQFFYEKGWRGINIDPNEQIINKLEKYRKRDINIQKLISDKEELLDYNYYETSLYNGVNSYKNIPSKHIRTEKMRSESLNSVLSKIDHSKINFIDIDVEGKEIDVLKSIDLIKYKPQALIVETMHEKVEIDLKSEIYKYLYDRGYIYFCKTVTNTIYLSEKFYINRFNV